MFIANFPNFIFRSFLNLFSSHNAEICLLFKLNSFLFHPFKIDVRSGKMFHIHMDFFSLVCVVVFTFCWCESFDVISWGVLRRSKIHNYLLHHNWQSSGRNVNVSFCGSQLNLKRNIQFMSQLFHQSELVWALSKSNRRNKKTGKITSPHLVQIVWNLRETTIEVAFTNKTTNMFK